MDEQSLTDISPHLRLRISPRARRMALRLDNAARIVNLVVPPRFSTRKAEEFARAHKAWIEAKIAALPVPLPFADGAAIPVLGRERIIRIERPAGIRATTITLTDFALEVRTNQDDPSGRIARFLKTQAGTALEGLAREKAAVIGKPVAGIHVRDTKSRWGSCAPDGRLCFSWRLILAPEAAMDYVAAHEVAHLKHHNHGPRFWALCESLCADYAAGRSWMRASGHELMRYGKIL